jgi:hypothetical protein
VTVHPRRADTGATTIVAKLDAGSGSPLLPGQSQTFFLNFTDPVQRDTFIGAANVVTPLVATTDYTMNTAPPTAPGSDVTASFHVTATVFASSIKIVVTNVGSARRLRDEAAGARRRRLRAEPDHRRSAARREHRSQRRTTSATSICPTRAIRRSRQLRAVHRAPLRRAARERARRHVLREPVGRPDERPPSSGRSVEKVALIDTVNGLVAGQAFYINAVRLVISDRNRIDCTWQLAPADTTRYWVLGNAGSTELGLTTILGI